MIEPERTERVRRMEETEVDDSEVGELTEDWPDEETDRISVLSEAECLQLLGEHDLGRVAIVLDGQPEIFPVNYAVGVDVIAIRTSPGTKLAHAPMTRVAFEVDGVDRVHGVAWSIVVKGVAHEVTDALGRVPEAVRRLAVEPMAPGQRAHWLTVQRQEMTGRRFPLAPF